MGRSSIIIIAIVSVIAIFGIYGCNKRNSFLKLSNEVKKKTSDIDVQYQRRLDLVDQMVKTVKGQVNFEQKTLTDIVNARAKATQMKIDVEKLNAEDLKKFQAAQGELSQALGRFLSISENYPELKSNAAFSELRTTVEGTENRIQFARNDFNAACTNFNNEIHLMPGSIFAWGYSDFPLFEAERGAEKRPEINFEQK
ncbi:MAG: LemA family protein [Bacteroidota bacterium]|jgi:LemA protein